MVKALFALPLLTLMFTGADGFAQSTQTAYINAHVLPVSGSVSVIEGGTIIVADGKIKAIGAHLAVPPGARRVDLHGATVIPGLIDASSSLFLTDETITGTGTPDQNILDGIDPFDKAAFKALSRGVTTVYVSPGSRGGMGGVVKLQNPNISASHSGAGTMEITLKSKAGVQFALGISTGGRSTPLERISSYEQLRAVFASGKQYVKAQAKSEQQRKAAIATAAGNAEPIVDPSEAVATERVSVQDGGDDYAQRGQGRRGGPGGARPDGPATAPRAQPAQEVLAAALKGDIPVRIEAHRADDILNALRLMDEFKFKLVLEAPSELNGLVSEIQSRKVGIIWTPARPTGLPTLEVEQFNPRAIASLSATGTNIAISARSTSGTATRFLLDNAALASGYGLSHEAALKAVTLGPAQILGVADHVGSLAAGKDADMVVLSGSPWDPQSTVQFVIANGVQVYAAH